jgi:hypothetical protein
MKIVKSVSVKRESMADILNSATASVNGGCLANILISFSVKGRGEPSYSILISVSVNVGGAWLILVQRGSLENILNSVIEAGSGW